MKKQLIFAGLLALAFLAQSQTPGLQVTSGTAGQSGLKFSNINSSTGTAASNGKVLSVNTSGDVILVPDQTASPGGGLTGANNGCSLNGTVVELGNAVGGTAANLSSNRQIFQNNKSIIFSGDLSNDMFQIGNNGFNTASRFHVENRTVRGNGIAQAISCFAEADGVPLNVGFFADVRDKVVTTSPATENVGGYFLAQAKGISKGIKITSNTVPGSNGPTFGAEITATDANGPGAVYGVKVDATGGAGNVYGIYCDAGGGVTSVGGFFGNNNSTSGTAILSIGSQGFAGNNPVENVGAQNNASGGTGINSITYGTRSGAGGGAINFGVKSDAQGNSVTNYGVHGYADGANAINYGVYGIAGPNGSNSKNFGVYGEAIGNGLNWAGYFKGDVQITNDLYNNSILIFSDKRFKDNIMKLESVNQKLKKLGGYTYTYKTTEFKEKSFPVTEQIGLIAQEIKEVFPQLVKEGADGYLAVNYQGLIPVLLEATKEQQLQIENQQQQIEALKTQNELMNQKLNSTTGVNNFNPIETGFQMSQNEPNPFTHETVVKYTLPTSVANAFMAVYDLTGKQIATFPIEQKGSSSLTITSEKLAAGIYIYSIVADGKVVDSKRMIVAEK